MKNDILIDADGVRIGSRHYIGKAAEVEFTDIGRQHYDCKVYHYANGKYQMIKANQNVFRIPVVGVLPKKVHRAEQIFNCYDVGECDNCSEKHHCKEYLFRQYDTHDEVRSDNIQRAISRLQQIILSNEWDYWVTFTFDDSKIYAKDNKLVIDKLTQWLKNRVQRDGIGYLLVPEYHKKEKRIHAHCLVRGKLDLLFNDIWKVKGIKKPIKGDTIKRYGIHADRILYKVYNVHSWKYGFSTAIDVYGSPSRLANYVTKYMTKDISKIFGKHYWCSKNLKLYPTVELYWLDAGEYNDTHVREYYHRGSTASFKYVNNLSEVITDMCDDEEVI